MKIKDYKLTSEYWVLDEIITSEYEDGSIIRLNDCERSRLYVDLEFDNVDVVKECLEDIIDLTYKLTRYTDSDKVELLLDRTFTMIFVDLKIKVSVCDDVPFPTQPSTTIQNSPI